MLSQTIKFWNKPTFYNNSLKMEIRKFIFNKKICKTELEVHERDGYEADLPYFNKTLIFKDHPEFKPNLTPKEVLNLGSFGGTYFRPIKSSVTKLKYDKMWKELPQDWLKTKKKVVKKDKKKNIIIELYSDVDDKVELVKSSKYNKSANYYYVKCGSTLEQWEDKGWIVEQDPYGWFQWYCRFYLGRRSEDDERQIKRWRNFTGDKGRFKRMLINKIRKEGKDFDDITAVSYTHLTLPTKA